jgi:CHAT domain-containing protein
MGFSRCGNLLPMGFSRIALAGPAGRRPIWLQVPCLLVIGACAAWPLRAQSPSPGAAATSPRWAPVVTAADLQEAERLQLNRAQATQARDLVARNRLLQQELALRRGRLPAPQQAEAEALQAVALAAYRSGDYAAAERGFAAIGGLSSALALPVSDFLPADAAADRLLPLDRTPDDDLLDAVVGLLSRLFGAGCGPAATAKATDAEAVQTLQAHPGFVSLRVVLADCLARGGQHRRALQEYERVAAAWPDAGTRIELGRARLRAGDASGARQAFAAAWPQAADRAAAAGGQAAAAAVLADDAAVERVLAQAVADLRDAAAFERFAEQHRALLLAAGVTPQRVAAWLATARQPFDALADVRQRHDAAQRLLQSPVPGDPAQRAADLPRRERAVADIEALFGASHPLSIEALGALAAAYSLADQAGREIATREAQLQRAERAFGAAHPAVATALQSLALALQRRGETARALALFDRAAALAAQVWGASHPRAVETSRIRAQALQRAGEPAAAAAAFDALAAQLLASQPWGALRAEVLRDAAALQSGRGQAGEARRSLEAVLRIARASGNLRPPRLRFESDTLRELGRLYRSVGNESAALRCLHLAMLAGEAPDTFAYNAFRLAEQGAVAMIHLDAGRPHLAEYFIRRGELTAGMVVEGVDPRASDADRRRLYAATGRLPEALALAEAALREAERRHGGDSLAAADALLPVADLQQRLGQLDRAEASLGRRLALNDSLRGPSHPRTGEAVQRLAWLRLAGPQPAQALALFQRSAGIAARHGDDEALWLAQTGAAAALAGARGRDAEAIFHAKLAVAVLQRLRGGLAAFDAESRRGFVASRAWPYRFLADRLIAAGRIGEAQRVMAMLKEQEFVDFVRRDASADTAPTPLPLTELEAGASRRYASLGADVAQRAAEARGLEERQRQAPLPAAEQARLAALRQRLAEAQVAFDVFVGQLTQLLAGRTDTAARSRLVGEQLQSHQNLLDDLGPAGRGVALLQYVATDERLNVVVSTSQLQVARQAPVGAVELNRRIAAFRQAVQNPAADPRPAARALHRVLIDPVLDDLRAQGVHTLVLVLDGALRYLPFAALHDGQQYLVQRYRLAHYTEAARSRLAAPVQPRWRVAAMGVTRAFAGQNFSALPAVRAELEGIVRDDVLPGQTFIDDGFTLAALRQNLDAPVLHIASHFQFVEGSDDSFLLLGDGSRLTLRQVRSTLPRFSNVDLLTLSACDTATGGGLRDNGLEVEGLGVLAQQRGARAVLATLWPVADASTGELMQRFYRARQAQGLNKAEALREAQLGLLGAAPAGTGDGTGAGLNAGAGTRGARLAVDATPTDVPPPPPSAGAAAAPFAHPYFWAPFVLMGNWL